LLLTHVSSKLRMGDCINFFPIRGILAPEATQGFYFLEMTQVARVLDKAIALFDHPYPREYDERNAQLEKLCSQLCPGWQEQIGKGDRSKWDAFHSLDNEFTMDQIDFQPVANRFVKEHLNLFFKS